MNASDTNAPDYSPGSPQTRRCAAVPAELAGQRFDAALAKIFPSHSRSRLQAWMKSGAVLVDGKPVDPKRRTCGGEIVEVLIDASGASDGKPEAEEIPLRVIFEDAHLLVIDKPVGMVVHTGKGNR